MTAVPGIVRSTRDAVTAIEAAFASAEGMVYLGEDVTMIEHQLQCGALASAADVAEPLVVACLVHDIGHMVAAKAGELDAGAALGADTDAHHETSGARWLARWFGPEVTEPVRLHVAAKRFLVATDARYATTLSAASLHTLALQGGPMSRPEVAAYRGEPFAKSAVALRRFDEAAKDAAVEAPSLDSYRPMIERVLRGR